MKYCYFEKIDILNTIKETYPTIIKTSKDYYFRIENEKIVCYELLLETIREIAKTFDVSIKDLEEAILNEAVLNIK